MNGAEALLRTLVNGGVEVCFSNPGTSEMHFVAALENVPEMRPVLTLFEGVASGAADGYGRMSDNPASTLLHLGSGLGNGLANLHNAKRARTPVVNIVGEHASYHLVHDAPLTSDIEGLARPVSGWVRTSRSAQQVGLDAAAAIVASKGPPGQVATLILPADTAWTEGAKPADLPDAHRPAASPENYLADAVQLLRSGEPGALLISGPTLRAEGLRLAGAIAAKTGVRILAQTSNGRIERGAGRVPIERVPYPVDQARDVLKGLRYIILIGASAPVAFFGYPGKPSVLSPPDCVVFELCSPAGHGMEVLAALSEAIGAQNSAPVTNALSVPAGVSGAITPDTLGVALARAIPENAIVVDESISSGRGLFPVTHQAPPHDWLQLAGGAIGEGMPMALGAAVACPDRPVISLQADGSGMYTLQALWSQAREGVPVTTVILANRAYAILKGELRNVGVDAEGPRIRDMMELRRPTLDWISLAKGMGVGAERVDDAEDLTNAIKRGLASQGPYLVEAVME